MYYIELKENSLPFLVCENSFDSAFGNNVS